MPYDNANERLRIKETIISELVEENNGDLVSGHILSDIRGLPPYYNIQYFKAIPEVQSLLNTYESNIAVGLAASQTTFNVNAAIKYAETYAYKENSAYKYYKGADCTNFVSPIMRAGGVSMNPLKWCYNDLRPTRSWTSANEFANCWGEIM